MHALPESDAAGVYSENLVVTSVARHAAVGAAGEGNCQTDFFLHPSPTRGEWVSGG